MTSGSCFRKPFAHDKLNLVALPQAGSDSALFMRWSKALGGEIAIQPAALPGRAARLDEAIPASLDALADHVFDDLSPLLTADYALMGSSMGAWLAYELAVRIESRGLPGPRAVIALTAPPPHARRCLPELGGLTQQAEIDALVAFNPAMETALSYPELAELVLPAIRADFQNCAAYQRKTRAPIRSPLLVISGAEDPIASAAVMEEWQDYAAGAFDSLTVPGDHSLIETPPQQLLAALRARLIGTPVRA